MSFSLGFQPLSMDVHVSRGADFISAIVAKGSEWPSGAEVSLRVGSQTWPAEVTAETISWNVDKAQVDELIDSKKTVAKLTYVEGDADLLWAVGRVIVDA